MRRLHAALFVGALAAASAACAPASGPVATASDEPGPRAAQEAEVLSVVQRFFDTMTARDGAGAASVLVMDGQFTRIRETDTGAVVQTTPLATYVEGLGTGTRRQVERLWDPVVLVDDRIAMVWTPYDFSNDGALSHCGIDVFSLVRTDAGWKIANVTYTVEPEGCARLGRPGTGRP